MRKRRLKKVNQTEIKEIISKHAVWLESNGIKGEKADFSFCDLSDVCIKNEILKGAIFFGANLENAKLIGCDLEEGVFTEAKLENAMLMPFKLESKEEKIVNLRNAKFINANLDHANLFKADLSGADLYNAVFYDANLEYANLEGADLGGAKFAQTFLKNANLMNVKGYSSGCMAGSDLTNVKISGHAAQFDEINQIAEISKNSRKTLGYLLISIIYALLTIHTTNLAALITNRPTEKLPIIGGAIPIASFYCVFPLVILATFLYLHIYLQKLWESLANIPAIFPDGQISEKRVYPWILNGIVYKYVRLLKSCRPPYYLLQVAAIYLLIFISAPSIMLIFFIYYLRRGDIMGSAFIMIYFTISAFISLYFHGLMKENFNIKILEKSHRYKLVFFKALRIASLIIFCILAFFVPPLLGLMNQESPLRLIESDYSGLNLEKADFEWHDFSNCSFRFTNLKGANLHGANFKNANMFRADLRGADISFATFDSANLQEANLMDAKGINIIRLLKSAKNSYLAYYDENVIQSNLGTFSPDHNSRVKLKNFSNENFYWQNLLDVNFEKCDLSGSNFHNASLKGVNFQYANLKGADLSNVKDLTAMQLAEAIYDSTTKLPNGLAYLHDFNSMFLRKQNTDDTLASNEKNSLLIKNMGVYPDASKFIDLRWQGLNEPDKILGP